MALKWSLPRHRQTSRTKKENSQQFQTKIYPHTLAHPVNCLSPCSVRTQRPQLQWQIVRRFSFWHAKSLITSVCSQRVFPENHWKTAEDNTWISAHSTRSWHPVTLPRSLHRNNPPNFPFLLPPLRCSLLPRTKTTIACHQLSTVFPHFLLAHFSHVLSALWVAAVVVVASRSRLE